jgi:hypothetical protein
VERRDSVSLAFIAALQLLPASQRAALVLHDVLAWRSDEIADLLDTTVPAVNSALQRARASVARAAAARRSLDTDDRRVLARFIDAWHRGDVAGLAAVLRQDVVLRMPPEAMEFAGRDDVVRFFATVPGGGRFDTIRLVATRANGQPALAAFEPDVGGALGPYGPYGLMVLDLDGGVVAGITGSPRCLGARSMPPSTSSRPDALCLGSAGLSPRRWPRVSATWSAIRGGRGGLIEWTMSRRQVGWEVVVVAAGVGDEVRGSAWLPRRDPAGRAALLALLAGRRLAGLDVMAQVLGEVPAGPAGLGEDGPPAE